MTEQDQVAEALLDIAGGLRQISDAMIAIAELLQNDTEEVSDE